jgi:hypothetical protein
MLPKWALNQVLRGCNKFQRTLGEFIAFTGWSSMYGASVLVTILRAGGAPLVPCGYGNGGDRTHGRSKSCWLGLREIRSRVASSRCIALPTIWFDDVVLSPWTRTLIRCWLFPCTLVKCECLCESRPQTSNFNRKGHVEVNFNLFESIGSFKERTSDNIGAGCVASSSFCCTIY